MEFWTDPIKVTYEWLMITFTGWGMAGWLADILINLIGIVVLIMAAMVLDIMLVWVERKVVARFQGRLGPNRGQCSTACASAPRRVWSAPRRVWSAPRRVRALHGVCGVLHGVCGVLHGVCERSTNAVE